MVGPNPWVRQTIVAVALSIACITPLLAVHPLVKWACVGIIAFMTAALLVKISYNLPSFDSQVQADAVRINLPYLFTQGATVLLAILLVTALVTPVMAFESAAGPGPGPPPADERAIAIADTSLTRFTMGTTPTPRERKRAAIETAAAMNTFGRQDLAKVHARSTRWLNGTLEEYRDGTRVDSVAVFDNDSRAVQALARFGETDQKAEVELATQLVVQADNTTATTAIADAHRALNRTVDRIDARGPTRAARAHIENAERAYDRGQAVLDQAENKSVKQRVKARARAIEQFAIAWLQAQLAIDQLDQTTTPKVVIRSRADPARNGSAETTRRIVGAVVDVQAYELENATVQVNSGPARTVSLNTTTSPATNATFQTDVEFLQQNTTINITVVDAQTSPVDEREFDREEDDSEDDEDERSKEESEGKNEEQSEDEEAAENPEDGENCEKEDTLMPTNRNLLLPQSNEPLMSSILPLFHPELRLIGLSEEDKESENNRRQGPPKDREEDDEERNIIRQVGTDILRLDGDRLPDHHELRTARTDPLNPDSDSDRTAANEVGNGIRDGIEDFDDDNLITYFEIALETDPFDPDTDGDNLTDTFEVQYQSLKPLAPDSNDDGTADPNEDLDSDGLVTDREAVLETNPVKADTDADQLGDRDEVEVYSTNVTDPDTDDDNLLDGAEIQLGTDPLVADSDRDGILDGNETFTMTAHNESVGASVDLTGQGNVASGVTIKRANRPSLQTSGVQNASAAPLLSLESNQSFDNASVTIEYDAAAAGNEPNLSIFRFNESLGTFERLPSTVDVENDTITATTTQFSTFAVFNVKNWGAIFSADLPGGRSGGDQTVQLVDVVFMIDNSNSMSEEGSGPNNNDPQGFRVNATKEFVGALIDGDRAAVIDFGRDANLVQPLTTDFAAVNQSLDTDTTFGTELGGSIRLGIKEFDRRSTASRGKIGILLTDGQPYRDSADPRQQARRAAERNITIYTIGFGDANSDLLRDIARITGGEYNEVDKAEDLPEVFSRIADNTAQPQDTDGDGLSDSLESTSIPTGTGDSLNLNPNDPDVDNDGLTDGQELGQRVETDDFGTFYDVNSHPKKKDSDGDGLTDYEETVPFSYDPRNPDTDGDGLDDGTDPNPTVPRGEQQTLEDVSFFGASRDVTTNAVKGAVLGDAGVVFNVKGSQSLEYFGGWLVASIAPGIDVAADGRDCIVLNNDVSSNLLDCGGAVISTAGSIGTVVGTITAPTGFGGALATGSFVVDTAEDISDVATLTARFIKHSPKASIGVGQLVVSKVDGRPDDVVQRVIRKLPDNLAQRFAQGVARQRLIRAGLDKDTAIAIGEIVPRVDSTADELARIVKEIDNFGDLPLSHQSQLAEKLAKSDEGLSLARQLDNLDASTLRTVVGINKIDEGAALVRSTSQGAQLLNSMSSQGVQDFLRIQLKGADDVYGIDAARAFRQKLAELYPKNNELDPVKVSSIAADVRTVERSSIIGANKRLATGVAKKSSWEQAKGPVYEIQSAANIWRISKATDVIDDLNVNQLDEISKNYYNVDFASLANDEGALQQISDATSVSKKTAKQTLKDTKGIELDVATTGNTLVYAESKAGELSKPEVKDELVKLKALSILSDNIDDVRLVFATRLEPKSGGEVKGSVGKFFKNNEVPIGDLVVYKPFKKEATNVNDIPSKQLQLRPVIIPREARTISHPPHAVTAN